MEVFAKMLTQFYFTISSVQRLGGSVQLEGECFLYHQATPDYQLLLTDEAGSYEAETAVQGNTFVASAEAENDREYEVKIRIRYICVSKRRLSDMAGRLGYQR